MSNREFFEIWNNAASTKEAAYKAGLSVTSCAQKASRLRSLGVPMKLFKAAPTERKREKDEFLAQFARKEAVQP